MQERLAAQETTRVRVKELPLLADIGINPDEIGRRQPLVISMEVTLTVNGVDAIEQTVDYRRLVQEAEELSKIHIPLIETFGHRLAQRCMAMANVQHVRIAIDKPFAITRGLAGVEVTMGRS